jgi:hypothetical protein
VGEVVESVSRLAVEVLPETRPRRNRAVPEGRHLRDERFSWNSTDRPAGSVIVDVVTRDSPSTFTAPIQIPPRIIRSWFVPSGYSNDGSIVAGSPDALGRFVPRKPLLFSMRPIWFTSENRASGSA